MFLLFLYKLISRVFGGNVCPYGMVYEDIRDIRVYCGNLIQVGHKKVRRKRGYFHS